MKRKKMQHGIDARLNSGHNVGAGSGAEPNHAPLPPSVVTPPTLELPVPPPLAPASEVTAPPPKYRASFFSSSSEPLPPEFVASIKDLEQTLKMPVWFLIQNEGRWSDIDGEVYKAFHRNRAEIEEGKPAALLLESPGGSAHCAYYIARLFQRRASEFTVVVPQYAKSAATLLALGASNLVLGRDAELGPLDVQMFDPEREDYDSALNAVQSLERLNAFSITAIDQTMQLLMYRTRKKMDTLLPIVLEYVNNFVRPLLEKIDTVDFTKKSRELKVAEQYAVRLMQTNYPFDTAVQIARQLVERYPTHGFVIDRDEAGAPSSGRSFGLGLKLQQPSADIEKIMERLVPYLDHLTLAGRLKEVK